MNEDAITYESEMGALPRAVLLIDGENLVFRYQEMLATGRVPWSDTSHKKDIFVWNPRLTYRGELLDIRRVCYYTSAVGDDPCIAEILKSISQTKYQCSHENGVYSGQIIPRVFKKSSQSQKSRHVDINIAIDAMSYAHLPDFDLICLATGDGDFLPLVREVVRIGKQVNLAAFSSGLSPELQYNVDDFYLLDQAFFMPVAPQS